MTSVRSSPSGGQTYALVSLADRLREIPQMLEVMCLTALSCPDDHKAAIADDRESLEQLLRIYAWHLRDAAERLDRKEAAAHKAEDRAERTIARHIEGVQADAIGASFDPRGFFVYCLWGRDDNRPLYVGKSTNILCRLGSHLGERHKNHAVERVTLLRCKTAALMDSTESRLISDYQPPWNIVGIRRE